MMIRFYHVNRTMLYLGLIQGLVSALGFLASAPRAQAQAVTPEWFDRGWDYRREVAVTNPCSAVVGDYQVQVLLGSSNFDFANALPDGRNLRVTAADGITAIPFWIESWDAAGELVQFSGDYIDPGLLVHQPLAPDLTYTWYFGDGATASGTLTPEHAYADEGFYTVTLVVTDDLGSSGSDTLQVTVENAAPVIVLPPDGTDLWAAMHAEIVLEISFTDPGWEDAHTLRVEWGDNTETWLTLPAGELAVSPVHVYDQRGEYTVVVTLADEDGGQTQRTYTVTVEPGFIQYMPVIHTP